MTDYTELANRLRKRGERINKFGSPFFTEANANDMIAAANAIEELQKIANKLLAKYQEEAETVIWEHSGHIDESMDCLYEEVRRLQAQIDGKKEPPKEGDNG